MAVLDDACLERVLSFVSEPRGRECCRAWDARLREALALGERVRFHQAMLATGSLQYHHTTVRDLGGLEECLTYSFAVLADRTYTLHWFREGLTSDNEQQRGHWRAVRRGPAGAVDAAPGGSAAGAEQGDRAAWMLRCETAGPPTESAGCERFLRHAPAGRIFEVPLEAILAQHTAADGRPSGAWELAARGLQPDTSVSLRDPGAVTADAAPPVDESRHFAARPPPREGARFVDVDGEMHEVSQDIVDNWSEADWPRLMRCRIRFGTGAERWP